MNEWMNVKRHFCCGLQSLNWILSITIHIKQIQTNKIIIIFFSLSDEFILWGNSLRMQNICIHIDDNLSARFPSNAIDKRMKKERMKKTNSSTHNTMHILTECATIDICAHFHIIISIQEATKKQIVCNEHRVVILIEFSVHKPKWISKWWESLILRILIFCFLLETR